MSNGKILSFAIRGEHPDEGLLRAAADILRVERPKIALLLDDSATDSPIRAEINRHGRGFLTNLVLYLDKADDERLLARELARVLGQDVIVPLPAEWTSDPYWWLLVQPSGQWYLVDEQPDMGTDLVPNEAAARPLAVDDLGKPRSPWGSR